MNRATIVRLAAHPAAGFLLLTALFLGVYGLAVGGAALHLGGDTTAYEEVARHQLSWHNIFSTQRPPIYPALIRLVDFSRPALAALQFAAYVLAWIFLAAVLWRRRLWLAAAVFYVGLYPGFAAWNDVLMTESPDISMSVAGFALLLLALEGRGWAVWAFIALMVLKCLLRGFDSVLDLVYLPVLALGALRRRVSWPGVAAAVVAAAACLLYVNTSRGPIPDSVWFFAMLNNIGTRVLPDPAWRQYFIDHGMPVNQALLSMTGHWAHEENWKFFRDPTLADFRAWVTAHGRATYTSYLLVHPKLIFTLLWQHRDEVFLAWGFPLWLYFDPGYRLGVPPWPPFIAVYALGSLGALAIGAALLARRLPGTLLLPAASAALLWLMLLPTALATYHGDAGDIPRHAVPLLVEAALSLLLMLQVAARWRAEARAAA